MIFFFFLFEVYVLRANSLLAPRRQLLTFHALVVEMLSKVTGPSVTDVCVHQHTPPLARSESTKVEKGPLT